MPPPPFPRPLAPLLVLFVQLVAGAVFGSPCGNYSFVAPPNFLGGSSPQVFKFVSVDRTLGVGSVSFVTGTGSNYSLAITARYDPIAYEGLNVKYTVSNTSVTVYVTHQSLELFSGSGGNCWSVLSAAASAGAGLAVATQAPVAMTSLATLPLLAMAKTPTVSCANVFNVEVVVTLPAGLTLELVDPFHTPVNQFWYEIQTITAQPTPSPVSHIGCFDDLAPPANIFAFLYDSGTMTSASCANVALASFAANNLTGPLYIGLGRGEQCFASQTSPFSALQAGTDCNLTCPTSNEPCGGLGTALDVYQVFTMSPTPLPTASPTNPCNCNCECLHAGLNQITRTGPYPELTKFYQDKIAEDGIHAPLSSAFQHWLSENFAEYETRNTYNRTLFNSLIASCNCPAASFAPTTAYPTGSPAPPTQAPTFTGATYLGCYPYNSSAPRMNTLSVSTALTLGKCRDAAEQASEKYFGVSGNSCMAGSNFVFISSGGAVSDLFCLWNGGWKGANHFAAVTCGGDSTQMCADSTHLALYQVTGNSATRMPTTAALQSYKYLGCYADNAATHLLGTPWITASLDDCYQNAAANQYSYFALEGSQCFVTNALTLATVLGPSTDCVLPCSGIAHTHEVCGAAWGAMSLFQVIPTASPTLSPTFKPTKRPTTAKPTAASG